MRKIKIGTSGWSYNDWDGVFYPKIPASERLCYYAKFFNTVELNASFYRLPSLQMTQNWARQVPKSFLFAVKASRYMTHIKRLKNCEESLRLFYRNLRPLKQKLGPILFQLPPRFQKNLQRLEAFIQILKPNYRYAFEFRSDSWFDPELYQLLKQHNIAICISDLNGHLTPLHHTADFIYIRLHGPTQAYRGSYGKKKLTFWAKKIAPWIKEKKDVYLYFNNDEKGYAIKDGKRLSKLLLTET